MKQTSSFQRWRRRYFKLKGGTLYYAKDTKVNIRHPTSPVSLSKRNERVFTERLVEKVGLGRRNGLHSLRYAGYTRVQGINRAIAPRK